MSRWIVTGYRLLLVLLCGTGLFLSVWIILTAPIFSLYPLSVAAPELSPWLMVINFGAIALSAPLWLRANRRRGDRRRWMLLGGSLIGFLLSALPLLQFPIANQRFAADLEQFRRNLPAAVAPAISDAPQRSGAKFRPAPLVISELFTGIPLPEVRYLPDIQFAAPDGVPLTLDVYRPLATGKYAAVVMIHGGAWRGGSAKDYPQFNRYLAAQGYTVVAISYRFAPRYRFPAQLDDVRSALKFIDQHAAEYEIDPARMVVMGRSAGAHLALLVANQARELALPSPLRREIPPLQAVISYYGPVDLIQGYQNPPIPDPIDSRAVLKAFTGGTPDQLPDLYKQASPMYAGLSSEGFPTLLVYGGQDHVVKATLARQYRDRLNAATNQTAASPPPNVFTETDRDRLNAATNQTALLLEIPWAEHAFDSLFNGVSNQLALYYTERFLERVVGE